jgi:hypothetical protein
MKAIELQDEVASLMADLREEFVKDCERLYRIKQKLNGSVYHFLVPFFKTSQFLLRTVKV